MPSDGSVTRWIDQLPLGDATAVNDDTLTIIDAGTGDVVDTKIVGDGPQDVRHAHEVGQCLARLHIVEGRDELVGVDGAVDATTTINADGTITVGGDDRSAFIDGRSIAQAKIQQTLAQMDKIVGAYQNYFTSRYMVNTSRDTAVNYFANGPASWGTASNWDTGGSIVSTAGVAQALTWNNFYQGLGLSLADVVDAYGQTITVDNSSDSTRNPDNQTSAAMQSPPYTTVLSTNLPGGLTMTRTVTGTY